jgi:hypothetical protein
MTRPLTTRLERKLTAIRGIAEGLVASGELAEDSHALKEVKRIAALATQYAQGYQRRGGGRATQ